MYIRACLDCGNGGVFIIPCREAEIKARFSSNSRLTRFSSPPLAVGGPGGESLEAAVARVTTPRPGRQWTGDSVNFIPSFIHQKNKNKNNIYQRYIKIYSCKDENIFRRNIIIWNWDNSTTIGPTVYDSSVNFIPSF